MGFDKRKAHRLLRVVMATRGDAGGVAGGAAGARGAGARHPHVVPHRGSKPLLDDLPNKLGTLACHRHDAVWLNCFLCRS